MTSILLYDTTLRDGAQGENISFSAEDKLRIAKRLDDNGFHYIEGGWPGANPRDTRFFELAKSVEFQNAKLSAFGSTRKPGIRAEDDTVLKALVESGAPAVTIFGKTWDLHVTKIMANTLEENLAMISDSVAFLKSSGREVIYDAEHFFDGYKDNPAYALDTISAAVAAGADFIALCDTNGGTLPHEVAEIVEAVFDELETRFKADRKCWPVKMAIHAHNDCGLAVANSIEAVRHGASMVQGTINGYGERCGNADLTTIIPVLAFKMGQDCMPPAQLARLKRLSRFVSETANMTPLNSRPFVGKSAFAHKGGVHVSAVMKEPRGYEHMDPELVGNTRRVLMSDYSGKSNVEYKAKELGIDLENGVDSRKVVAEIKRLEEDGYQFDVADGSFKIFLQKFAEQYSPVFELESFRVMVEKTKDTPCYSQATIKIDVGGTKEITAAEGHGPVSALDNALRKALGVFYPEISDMHLVDYKVRVMDAESGTEAKVRVLIESRDENQIWSTIGVSEDIIEASWQALVDSFQYKLSEKKENGN